MRTSGNSAVIDPGIGVPLPPLERFFALFRDDNDCLEFLWRSRCSVGGDSALCPECAAVREFRVDLDKSARLRWSCTWCGYFLSPIAGTIFQKSQPPLHIYFDAIAVLGEPDRPIQVEELAYELGISLNTAAEVSRLLEGRLEAREQSASSFCFDVLSERQLVLSH